jgi:chromosome segregation ATPase
MRPLQQQSKVQDTKALSGGERSYSTVSLLLALWEAMENPFRAMDEFDVFMDSVNRQISIDLLIDAAREHKNRQFIFITPHDYRYVF